MPDLDDLLARKDHFILIGQTPVAVNFLESAAWMQHNDRRVMFTRLFDLVDVSTVFLCINHQFHPAGPPILFESMAFWHGEGGYEQERCSTWSGAEAMHRQMVAEVARPKAVLEYVRRMIESAWEEAKRDWRRSWKELRGIEPTEMDVMMDRMRERMDR